ncbi:adenylate/guanylate cyclase domain-containing protein [Enterovirga rhinocerotis]|uniref:adenylate/guanylate cyclase domain-containing protein n=1 Tax=Enterovirga rhinocerotis TaxID=1339210 RepID=UPI001FE12D00|nr:adenylate/guanylate cyclase domain-containing protein [Enterovirga rhinocerotis]
MGARLASGLALFAYVLAHLLNHALGNISVAAMERGLDWAGIVLFSLPGKILLYGAFLTHLGLGLYALYARRPFRYRPAEAAQILLGLSIPFILLQHIVATRLAFELYGTEKGYPQILYAFFVAAPEAGIRQTLLLLMVWGHGCLGLHFWLRSKPAYPRFAPWLLCLALLIPILALLGILQGGREILRLAEDPAWREANLTPGRVGTEAESAELGRYSDHLLLAYPGLIVAALLARVLRSWLAARRGLIAITYPDGRRIRVPAGTSVLEASRLSGIPHTAVCGGKGRCSTCRIRVVEGANRLHPASAAERAVLDRIGAGEDVRLACQLRPAASLTVAPLVGSERPHGQRGAQVPGGFGEERFIVAMFIDMRGSTRFAERHLPFDTIFVINRFLEAVGGAVAAEGGSPNQYLGDGVMVLFGLAGDREGAARQSLAALDRIGAAIDALNTTLAPNLDEPIRYGIGLHAGTAVLGEIGDRRYGGAVFTAIGDPVNVASRLQGLTKRFGVEALVSDAVFKAAGRQTDLPQEEVEIEGRSGRLWIRVVAREAMAAAGGD